MGGLRQRKGRPLRCGDLRYRVLMYAEGELDAPERHAVEAHLEGCEACRRVAEELRKVTLAVRTLRGEAATAPDAAWLACAVRKRVMERRGLRDLVARLNSWADDAAGPVLERPMEALVASGLVLWLAVSDVAGTFGLEKLLAKLLASALIRVGPLGM